MTNLNSKLLGGAAVALLAAAFAVPAQAQTAPSTGLYTGGGTLAEKVYRDVMNCYGATSAATDGGTTANLGNPANGCNTVTPYNGNVELLYVGVGSGNGKAALVNLDPSQFIFANGKTRTPDNPPVPSTTDFGPFYGSGTGTSWAPGTGPNFPKVSFIGSDDPLTTSDISTFQTHSSVVGDLPNQVPGLITTIAVPFNPTATWNPKGATVTGASSHVSLQTDVLCGIFTGAITDWSDNAFKAANAGQQLGNGPILVGYRNDSSGSTFLFTNALIHQCGSQTNPRTGITHPVPDQWLTDNGISNAVGAGPDGIGASGNSFFINVQKAGHIPANFTGAKGSGGIKGYVFGNAGAISYVSPDFALPIDQSGSASEAANLESWASFLSGTPKYFAPSAKNGTAIPGSVAPPSKTAGSCTAGNSTGVAPHIQAADGICQDNPLNWGLTFPTPTSTAAYPIGGFTFIDTYKCYANAADVTAIAGTTAGSLGYLRWYYGSVTENASQVKNQLTANGFSLIPGAWISAVKALLTTNKPTSIQKAGSTGKCSSVSGA